MERVTGKRVGTVRPDGETRAGEQRIIAPAALRVYSFAGASGEKKYPRDEKLSSQRVTAPKYVVSQTLANPEWNNTTVLSGGVVEEVRKLKQRYDGDIVVHGSPQLAQALIEHDLVDALHLQVYPVIVGAGKRLFGETSATKGLRLTSAKTVGSGILILIYERDATGRP